VIETVSRTTNETSHAVRYRPVIAPDEVDKMTGETNGRRRRQQRLKRLEGSLAKRPGADRPSSSG